MTTSLPQAEKQLELLKNAAGDLLGGRVKTLEGVGGGGNSRVYRLVIEPSRAYALKAYFQHASDNRARMETEFHSLRFLWKNGVRNIPEPVAASPEHSFAIYLWIEGRKIDPADVTAASIHSATRFLSLLTELRDHPESGSLGPASEACFSGRAILENLQIRVEPLLACADDPDLGAFLDGEFLPARERLADGSRKRMGEAFENELSPGARTLSPSDFGFHNALQTDQGEVYFLDMEYFGWDDPAKTISDFLLHPAMTLSAAFKQQFATAVMQNLASDTELRPRLEAYYPLFGLKWCLILLNEFLAEHLLRRRFAGMNDRDRRWKQKEQLAKAGNMLRRTLAEYERFPYLA